jgi:hypothetical protein
MSTNCELIAPRDVHWLPLTSGGGDWRAHRARTSWRAIVLAEAPK